MCPAGSRRDGRNRLGDKLRAAVMFRIMQPAAIGWGLVVLTGALGCAGYRPFDHQDVRYLKRLEREATQFMAEQPSPLAPPKEPAKPRLATEGITGSQRPLSLQRCIAIALAHNRELRVVAYDPAIASTRIAEAMAAFDAYLDASALWRHTETPSSSAIFAGGEEAIIEKSSQFETSITKPLPTGGSVAVSGAIGRINTSQLFTSLNPRYESNVAFSFSHPLLRNAGIEVNRSQIRVERLGKRISVEQFRLQVMKLLRDVEAAYWELDTAYRDLQSREAARDRAKSTYARQRSRLEFGQASVQDVEQARAQLEAFRAEVLEAIDRVNNQEAKLRRLMGVGLEERRRIITTDKPITSEVRPSWTVARNEALANRPEIRQQHLAIRAQQISVRVGQNQLLPQLDLSALYRSNGLGRNARNSLEVLARDKFNDWEFGLRFNWPFGNRARLNQLHRARLQLAKESATLDNLKEQVTEEVLRAYRTVDFTYALIGIRGNQRDAAERLLVARQAEFDEGRVTTDLLLEAQADLANAERDELLAIVTYNISLIDLELVQGTLLRHNNIVVQEAKAENGMVTAAPAPRLE